MGSIRSALKRASLPAALAVLAACAPGGQQPNLPISLGQRGQLIPQTVETLNDAGRSPSVALDKDGNPVVAYLLAKAELKPGEVPAPIVPGQPQPPAVVVATLSEGAWAKKTATPEQNGQTPEEVAKQIAGPEGRALPSFNVSMALDPQGGQHVVWSGPSGLFYSSGSADSFGEPERVARDSTVGASIAVGADGTPWIGYYQGEAVMAASLQGDAWATERVASVKSGTPELPARTAISVGTGGQPVLAYADVGTDTPMLARREGKGWASEKIEAGGGGLGISLDLDQDGNPHVAYYSGEGAVSHAHNVGSAGWEVTPLAEAPASAGESTAEWTTGIGLDDKGTHYVTWADPASRQIILADNREGDFAPQPVQGGLEGLSPSIAVGPEEGSLALAWYDAENLDLNVATPLEGGFALAQPNNTTPNVAPVPTPTTRTPACEPEGTRVEVTAQNLAFQEDCLAAPAQEPFSLVFNNQDPAPHNVAIYTDQNFTENLFTFEPFSGPKSMDFKVKPLEVGNYAFRCDVHPTTMVGQFAVVAPKK